MREGLGCVIQRLKDELDDTQHNGISFSHGMQTHATWGPNFSRDLYLRRGTDNYSARGRQIKNHAHAPCA